MSSKNRFAFCIIAHNQPELFEGLISQIDHVDNDIYVMIDSKADINDFNRFSTRNSKLVFCEKRFNIKWGGISQVKAEIELFRTAYNSGDYSYFHLLSGQDLLIKPVTALNEFISKNSSIQYIQLRNKEESRNIVQNRISYYHFLPQLHRFNNIMRLLPKFSVYLQKLLGLRRKWDVDFPMGANWVTISRSFVEEILSRKLEILKKFRFTLCPDELYKQYIFVTSTNHYMVDSSRHEVAMSLRKIDWDRGTPYVWKEEDYEELINSNEYIARKFSINNNSLVKKILNHTNL